MPRNNRIFQPQHFVLIQASTSAAGEPGEKKGQKRNGVGHASNQAKRQQKTQPRPISLTHTLGGLMRTENHRRKKKGKRRETRPNTREGDLERTRCPYTAAKEVQRKTNSRQTGEKFPPVRFVLFKSYSVPVLL